MRRAAVLICAAPLLLAACGGGSSSSTDVKLTPVASVKQAAKKSAAAPSEHVDLKATATLQGNPFALTGAGDFDNEKKTGAMAMHASVQGLDVQLDTVLDGTTVYLKSPLIAAGLPAGKTWAKVDLQQVGASKGIDLTQLLGQDPAQAFSQLQKSSHVTEVGDETVDGVDTAHYRGTVAAAQLPKPAAYDVWVGKDDGYVRRIRTSYSLQQQKIAMTMNFSDFGKDVSVDVPSAAESADMTDKSLQGLGG